MPRVQICVVTIHYEKMEEKSREICPAIRTRGTRCTQIASSCRFHQSSVIESQPLCTTCLTFYGMSVSQPVCTYCREDRKDSAQLVMDSVAAFAYMRPISPSLLRFYANAARHETFEEQYRAMYVLLPPMWASDLMKILNIGAMIPLGNRVSRRDINFMKSLVLDPWNIFHPGDGTVSCYLGMFSNSTDHRPTISEYGDVGSIQDLVRKFKDHLNKPYEGMLRWECIYDTEARIIRMFPFLSHVQEPS